MAEHLVRQSGGSSAGAAPAKPLDLSGFIQLNDAQQRWQSARINMAGEMVDVAAKWQQVRLANEQVIKARLENIAKALDIQWDSQAHAHLLKIRNQALREARILKQDGEKLRGHLSRIGRLLSGAGSWEAIRDAWVSFNAVRWHALPTAHVKAGSISVDPGAYERQAWLHPQDRVPPPLKRQDPGTLLDWARANTLYPVMGTPAWQFVAGYMQALADSAALEAAAIIADAEASEKEAREIAKLDWDRLNK